VIEQRRSRADVGARGLGIARDVCSREEFKAHRDRLPRAVRRDVGGCPPSHVGLIVQALAGPDSPVLAIQGHVRADLDPAGALVALERRLRGLLG